MQINFTDSVYQKGYGFSNFCEEILFLDGITNCVGGKKVEVNFSQDQEMDVQNQVDSSSTCTKFWLTILKLGSYMTVVLPAVALVGKLVSRYKLKVTADRVKKTSDKVKNVIENSHFSAGTYNVLFGQGDYKKNPYHVLVGYKNGKNGPEDNIEDRKKIIVKNIKDANLDVVCIQELTEVVFNELKQTLGATYQMSWVPHAMDHGVGILYKKAQFDLLATNTAHICCQISVPNKDTNEIKQIQKKRAVMGMDLRNKTTQKVIRVVSCHAVDPRDFDDKTAFTAKLVSFAGQKPTNGYALDGTIVAGDFNQDEYAETFEDKQKQKPMNPGAFLAASFSPFKDDGYAVDDDLCSSEYEKAKIDSDLEEKGRRIDWLFCKGLEPDALPLKNFDKNGSDHRFVAIKCRLPTTEIKVEK